MITEWLFLLHGKSIFLFFYLHKKVLYLTAFVLVVVLDPLIVVEISQFIFKLVKIILLEDFS